MLLFGSQWSLTMEGKCYLRGFVLCLSLFDPFSETFFISLNNWHQSMVNQAANSEDTVCADSVAVKYTPCSVLNKC